MIIFILAQTLNVILNTWKSIVTVKGSKVAAAAVNAITFGFYTWVLILIADASLGIVLKCIIVAACNFVGVYVVKLIEEKMRKDKMWKIEMTVQASDAETVHYNLSNHFIPNHYTIAGKHAVFSCFCETKSQTDTALAIGKTYNAKTFASETKLI